MRKTLLLLFILTSALALKGQERPSHDKSPQHAADIARAQLLADSASRCCASGNYREALKIGTEALQLWEQTVGDSHADYAESLNNLARYHSYAGNYIKAISMGRKAAELRAQLFGQDNALFAQSLSNLAGYYSRIGNYDKALKLGQQALHIREHTLGRNHADYAESLNNLAKYNYFMGRYEEAFRLEKEALALHEELSGKQNDEYATALSNLADYYLKTGHHDEALRYGQEALHIRRQVLGEHHPEYAESLSNMASYCYASGQYAQAVEWGRQTLNLRQQLLGKQHLSYAHSLCKQAAYYAANGQKEESEQATHDATKLYAESVLNTFADMTAYERNLFWTKVKTWFTNTLPLLASENPTGRMLDSAYDGTLLAKSILLNSEQTMHQLLMESGDSTLMNDYQKLQEQRSLLIRQYELPIASRTVNTGELRKKIIRQERRIQKRSKTYGDYTQALRVRWHQIAATLASDETAIEFVCFTNRQGNGQYAAMVITPGTKHPQWVQLADAKAMAALNPQTVYDSPRLSQLIWQPLEPYLKNARRIYFAPAGELYNIGIEYLPHWKKRHLRMNDLWQCYRLTSTRQLFLDSKRRQKPTNSAYIFGGIDYGKGRNGAKYLPSTKKEASEISQTLAESGISTQVSEESNATEATFKQLSGRACGIIHIATHGFYWTDSEVSSENMDERLQFLSAYGNMDDADKALTRSGLLFAGANHALASDSMPSRTSEDGILTAKEISMLDLRDVSLLVLSACQTGIGKVSGDGVFGLQRGFKKAGAHTILMTLWKVDDRATRLLMTCFYDNLTKGKSAHESLTMAQNHLRNMEASAETNNKGRRPISARKKRAQKNNKKKPYDAPYYWAGFILLDDVGTNEKK